jgi:hypothetical protein
VVLHFKESTAYLLPGHVNAAARRVQDALQRQERMSRPALEAACITLDRAAHEAEFQEALKKYRKERSDEATST